ncbi:MAG: hypothetical protein LBU32_21125 [Clostridiales bacterium]|nr:hypothetical protein [Clostridiales bacterium]
MEFMPIRSLSKEPKAVSTAVHRDGEVVITNGGKPDMLIVSLNGRDVFDVVNALRQQFTDMYNNAPYRPSKNGLMLNNGKPLSIQKKAVEAFFENIEAIENEPLGSEFDEIVNQRFNISRELDI